MIYNRVRRKPLLRDYLSSGFGHLPIKLKRRVKEPVLFDSERTQEYIVVNELQNIIIFVEKIGELRFFVWYNNSTAAEFTPAETVIPLLAQRIMPGFVV